MINFPKFQPANGTTKIATLDEILTSRILGQSFAIAACECGEELDLDVKLRALEVDAMIYKVAGALSGNVTPQVFLKHLEMTVKDRDQLLTEKASIILDPDSYIRVTVILATQAEVLKTFAAPVAP